MATVYSNSGKTYNFFEEPFSESSDAFRINLFSEMTNDTPATSNNAATTNAPTSIVKRFELPVYTPNNPDLWFLTCEIIFEEYGVSTEKTRFSAILQRLGPDQIAVLESIIRQKPADPYSQAKTRLIATDGKSDEEKLNQLLRGADIPHNTKPCVILQRLRALVSSEPDPDRLVRPIWLQNLPLRMQEVLSSNRNDPLDTICKTADRLYELAERNGGSVHAIDTTSTPAPVNDCLSTVLRLLTAEISALRADRNRESRPRERSRDRSHERSHSNYRPRNRSQTPFREQKTELINGQCWYHHTFGDRARNCAVGCSRYVVGNDK